MEFSGNIIGGNGGVGVSVFSDNDIRNSTLHEAIEAVCIHCKNNKPLYNEWHSIEYTSIIDPKEMETFRVYCMATPIRKLL